MAALALEPVTELIEGWEDTVITVLCLVVQHCPGASADPRDLCRLLQVSTACRTALQCVKGHCNPSVNAHGPLAEQKLRSYTAWAAAHSSLVQELACDINIYWENPPNGAHPQVAAAVTALSCLSSISLHSRYDFRRPFLSALSGHSQLTRVHIYYTAMDVAACLPASVVEVKLMLGGTAEAAVKAAAGASALTLDFQHLPVLQQLYVGLWTDGPVGDLERLEVLPPARLTELSLEGRVLDVALSKQQQSLDCLELLILIEAAMPFDRLAQVIPRLPGLRELWLDGALHPIGPGHVDVESKPQQLDHDESLSLAAVLGVATQLTFLTVEGFDMALSDSPWSDDDGVVVEQLQHLTALQSLDFALDLVGMRDVLGIASLTQLMALHLSNNAVDEEQHVQELCDKLSQLRVLTLSHTGVQSCQLLFTAVAQLTKLECLCLGHNYVLTTCEPGHLELLWPLVQLQQLTLPPSAEKCCSGADIRECLFEKLPVLEHVRVRHGGRTGRERDYCRDCLPCTCTCTPSE